MSTPRFIQLLLNHGHLNDGVREVVSSLLGKLHVTKELKESPKIIRYCVWSLAKCLTEKLVVVYVIGFLFTQSCFEMQVLQETLTYGLVILHIFQNGPSMS